jgi:hypothetical protein
MDNELNLANFNSDDVISFGNTTYKIGIFQKAATRSFSNRVGGSLSNELQSRGISIPEKLIKSGQNSEPYTSFFTDGIACEVLQVGSSGWKKGRVRFKMSVEFIPDEPELVETPPQNNESPLDDIRQMLNE